MPIEMSLFPHISGTPADARWYVVQTQPHGENKALFHLERQNYRVFCPRISKTVRHAGKTSRVQTPLFHSYLFVNLDIARERWRSINGTFGVSRIILSNEMPQAVPRGIVEALIRRTGDEGTIVWRPAFVIGQQVKIHEGPFADFVGELEHLDASGRVRVLLDMMGRGVSIFTQAEKIAPAF
jgi:transcription elongation factor/antiterminator RfaH